MLHATSSAIACIYIYIYIYVCVCVCVCMATCMCSRSQPVHATCDTKDYIHIIKQVYIYIYV